MPGREDVIYKWGAFMKITFLGDSIRQQYARRLKETFAGEFEVWHPTENGRFAQYTLRGLFDWSEKMAGTDIVHWNNGHWDVCDLFGDGAFTPEEEYVETMLRMADILQKKYKAVIFATTTPVRPENPYNRNSVIDRYNERLVPLLRKRGVIINDLNGLLRQDLYRYISEDNIHLSEEGIDLCADRVARIIRETAKTLPGGGDDGRTGQEPDKPRAGLPVLL